MNKSINSRKNISSDAELTQKIIRVAKAAQADAIIFITETGVFTQYLTDLPDQFRVIAATANPKTFDELVQEGIETVLIPLHAADKYRQIHHVISVALRTTKISIGDFIVCAIDRDVYPEEGNLVVVADVDPSLENLAITDLIKLTDGVRPKALEAVLTVACKIGRAARRGKRLGAIFVIGDSSKVLEGSKQLIPNPFQEQDEAACRLTNPAIHDSIIELAKLDGAFVIRGDGLIRSAGVFLHAPQVELELPSGLGTRHTSAAAVTKLTDATAAVISATDGKVRVFSGGSIVLQMDPDIEHGPISVDE